MLADLHASGLVLEKGVLIEWLKNKHNLFRISSLPVLKN